MNFPEAEPARRGSERRLAGWTADRLVVLATVYLLCLFIWAGLRFFFADRWAWLFLLNVLAPHLFWPLPAVLLINLLLRRRQIWIGSAAAVLLWAALYSPLFLPQAQPDATGRSTLTIMTYNVLAFNRETDQIISAVRRSEADIVALGELNDELAAALEDELAGLYPYQLLEPGADVHGAGIISRYPLQPAEMGVGGASWIGRPQVVTLDLDGQPVTIVHFHAIPLATTGGLDGLTYSIEKREGQAQALVDYALADGGPMIVLGDLNAGDQSRAYGILAGELNDAWRTAGWGLGHTFPGAASEKSGRPVLFGLTAPQWLARIDYIFYSDHWQAAEAWIGPWDGGSDHRPVMARLVLTASFP